MAEFSVGARERFLALMAVGYSLEAAAAAAGTSRTTVHRWLALGRALGASAEHRAFAERLDAIREGGAEDGVRLPDEEELALDRRDREDEADPFCSLPGDELAREYAERHEGMTPAEGRERRAAAEPSRNGHAQGGLAC